MKLSNFIQRVLTGAVYITILLSGILFGEYSFIALFVMILVFSLGEFNKLMEQGYAVKLNRFMSLLGGILFFVGMYVAFSSKLPAILSLAPFFIWMFFLFVFGLYTKKTTSIKTLAFSSLGILYIVVPIGLTNYLAFSYDANTYHYAYLLALFVFIWINDSFAYLIGSLIGKHRLFERISPKKSWEGFIGGAVFSIASASVFAIFFQEQTTLGWMGFASVVVVAGTLGDLFESLMKRELGVKDSGNILPGHGGILDRFDSLLFAIIPLVVYLELCAYWS